MNYPCGFPVWKLLATLCLLAAASAEAREFTDNQGRKLEGELLSVTGPQAVIKRTEDGRQFTVAVSQFSEEDRKFMAEFAATHVHYDFDVKLTKDRQGTTKSKFNNVTSAEEKWAYKVDLTNKSSADATDLRVDYWLFRKADDGKIKTKAQVQQSGSTKVGELKHAATKQFQTKAVVLTKQELDGGFYFSDGTKNKAHDSLGGVAMRFFQGDREVATWATDPNLLKLANGSTSMEREESSQ